MSAFNSTNYDLDYLFGREITVPIRNPVSRQADLDIIRVTGPIIDVYRNGYNNETPGRYNICVQTSYGGYNFDITELVLDSLIPF